MLGMKSNNQLTMVMITVILILPFNLASRFVPYQSFYQDIVVILSILAAFSILLVSGKLCTALPRGAIYFFILAAYWCFQPLVIDLPYAEQNIRIGLLFVLLGFLVWSVQALLLHYGREQVTAWVAWTVLIGVCIQAIALLLQFSGMVKWVSWLVFNHGENISGQFGQRNLLGHYMMWGVLAAAYLTGKHRLRLTAGITLILVLGACLALVNSRTIIAYVLAILLLLLLVRFFYGKANHAVAKMLCFAAIWVLLAQWLMPSLLSALGIEAQSGLDRLVDRPNAGFRTPEWSKAWYSFLNAPIFGHGWHSYAYQSIVTDWELIPDTAYHLNGYALHSHNMVLQILAEMGAVGGILVFGGLFWAALPMLKQLTQGHAVWILALLAVTACHSLLEFPLWYSYFLASATIFLALSTPTAHLSHYPTLGGVSRYGLLGLSTAGLLAAIFVLGLNQWFINKQIQAAGNAVNLSYVRRMAMFELGQHIPLLSPYGDMQRLDNIDITAKKIAQSDIQLIEQFNRYLPVYYMANLRGLALYRQGKEDEALQWLKKTWHYYPRQIPQSMTQIYQAYPLFKGLEMPVYQACLRQQELGLYGEKVFKTCEKPPSMHVEAEK